MANKSKLIRKAVELNIERLGDRVICRNCGATAKTMGDVCNVGLAVQCEGFLIYDMGRTQALHDVGFFVKQAGVSHSDTTRERSEDAPTPTGDS